MYRGPGGFRILPPIIKNLLIINGIFYLFFAFSSGQAIGQWMYEHLALHFPNISEGKMGSFNPIQLVSYMFLHDPTSIFHILFNMFGLWMFGSVIENVMGSKRFLSLYMFSGIGAGIIQLIVTWVQLRYFPESLMVPGYLGPVIPVVLGASGAVYGVLFSYAYYFPNQPIYLYFFIPVKAKYMMALLILVSIVSGFGGGDGIAHFAHLGGVLSAFLFLNYYRIKRLRR